MMYEPVTSSKKGLNVKDYNLNVDGLTFGIGIIQERERHLSSSSRLNDQERKTRIAFLQNQQAELETEIQLLKQSQEFEKLITDDRRFNARQ